MQGLKGFSRFWKGFWCRLQAYAVLRLQVWLKQFRQVWYFECLGVWRLMQVPGFCEVWSLGFKLVEAVCNVFVLQFVVLSFCDISLLCTVLIYLLFYISSFLKPVSLLFFFSFLSLSRFKHIILLMTVFLKRWLAFGKWYNFWCCLH